MSESNSVTFDLAWDCNLRQLPGDPFCRCYDGIGQFISLETGMQFYFRAKVSPSAYWNINKQNLDSIKNFQE